jgi:hypothetical protein
MGDTLQPSDDLQATILAVAHDLLMTQLQDEEGDAPELSLEEQATKVAQLARIIRDAYGK